jgi:predicted nucleic acid-binding protein
VSSPRDELVALDTNEFVFALRREARRRACETLLMEGIAELDIYIPLQVLVELQRNLSQAEVRDALTALDRAKSVTWDYALAQPEMVERWQEQGARKGDAMIVAQLEASRVRYLISENRHFLAELPALPFTVLTSEEALRLLD